MTRHLATPQPPSASMAPAPETTLRATRFRPAREFDSRVIARLYRIASDGVADYIWTRLAKAGEEPLEVGQRRYERKDTVFSYRNCTMATVSGRSVGMMMAFPMWTDPAELEPDPVLAPYSRLEEDASFYISGVALFPEYRNRGVGTRLLELAEKAARVRALEKTSLVVFDHNYRARRLYERLGYVERAREPVVEHPLIRYGGDALLMVKDLR